MTTQHTPGPWEVYLGHDGQFQGEPYILSASGVRPSPIIARILSDFGVASTEANARLIAAAPDLLEALRYARRFLKAGDHDVDFVDTAIKKAIPGPARRSIWA